MQSTQKPPYDINDMDAAVEYSKQTRQLFRDGKHAEAFAHYQQDPLGGAIKEGTITTQERFVARMYSMRDVQGEPLFPQPDGYELGDLAVGMKVQLAEDGKWQRVRQIVDFEGAGTYVMLDGSTELHKDADLFAMFKEPNAQQYAAVLAFSEKHGRRWKDQLMEMWTKGDYSKRGISTDQAALLQQVRNECGPEWLANERLSRKVEPILAVHSIELAGVTYYDMYEDMPGEHFATRQSVEHHDAPPSCSLAQAMELSIAMLNEADHDGDCHDGKFVPLTVILRDAEGRAVQEYAQHPGSKERAWLKGAPGEAEWSALEEEAKRLEERAHVESGWDNRDTSRGLGNQAMAIRRSVEIAKTLAEYGVSLADLTPKEACDMDAAVEYSNHTRQLFREGKHAEAFAHYQQDPLGGASEAGAMATREQFVAAMYSMRDVHGEPLFPQPDGYRVGDLAVGMKVQVAEDGDWFRIRQLLEVEGHGTFVMVDGSTSLRNASKLWGMYHEPTAEQYAAVLDFREKYGRQWKERMADVWLKGDYSKRGIDGDQAALLQQVRNECGPAWLADTKLNRKVEFDIWGNSDSEYTARRSSERFVDCETPPDGYTKHLIRVNAVNAREAVQLYHFALKEAGGIQYRVSIHSESWDAESRETGYPKARGIEIDSETRTLDDLVCDAQKYGIDSVSSSSLADPYVWFASTSPRQDGAYFKDGIAQRFTLHIHEVNGKEPSTEDYAHLAKKFGIKLSLRHEATADTDIAP